MEPSIKNSTNFLTSPLKNLLLEMVSKITILNPPIEPPNKKNVESGMTIKPPPPLDHILLIVW